MAIDTNTEKLALMEWCQVWEPGLPLSPGALGTDDQQQLLWGYPGIAWGEPPVNVSVSRSGRAARGGHGLLGDDDIPIYRSLLGRRIIARDDFRK